MFRLEHSAMGFFFYATSKWKNEKIKNLRFCLLRNMFVCVRSCLFRFVFSSSDFCESRINEGKKKELHVNRCMRVLGMQSKSCFTLVVIPWWCNLRWTRNNRQNEQRKMSATKSNVSYIIFIKNEIIICLFCFAAITLRTHSAMMIHQAVHTADKGTTRTIQIIFHFKQPVKSEFTQRAIK